VWVKQELQTRAAAAVAVEVVAILIMVEMVVQDL
tara:strand:- start:1144 stop:1245 length:102 start_codon:yes stop_codon:yes gene_type:complete